jgi:O-antigen/teichoic acid export membrane protein
VTGHAGGHRDTRDIVRGALVNFAGILAGSLSFVFLVVLGRLYGSETTGLYLLSLATVDIVSKLGILGLDRGVLALAARRKSDGAVEELYRIIGQALTLGLIATTVATCVLASAAALVARHFFGKPELVTPLRIMAFGIPFWTLSAIFLFATRALRVMRYEVITKRMVEPFFLLLLALPLHAAGMGMTGLALAFVCSTASGAVAAAWFYSRELSFGRTVAAMRSAAGRGALLRYAAPIGVYDMLNLLLQRIDMIMLGHYVSAKLLGVYGIAMEAAFATKRVRQSFDPIFIPVVAAAHQSGDRAGMVRQYRNVTRWILILDLAILGVVVFAGRTVLGMFGDEFAAGAAALAILTLSVVVNGVLGVAELFLLIEHPMRNLTNTVGTIVVNVLLNLWLIPRHGMVGAAAAIALSYAVMNAARVGEVAFILRLHPFSWFHGKALIAAGAAMAIAATGAATLTLAGPAGGLATAGIFLAAYFPLLAALGLAPEERSLARGMLGALQGKGA